MLLAFGACALAMAGMIATMGIGIHPYLVPALGGEDRRDHRLPGRLIRPDPHGQLAAPTAAVLYALFRPRTLEGPGVSIMRIGANGRDVFEPGPWVVVPWPFDGASAAGFAILAATAVFLATAAFALARSRPPRASEAS